MSDPMHPCSASACQRADRRSGAARVRWRILVLAALQLGLVASEGLLESPYYSSCLIPIGVVAISGRTRAVWACALLIDAIVAAAVLSASSPAELARSGALGTALGALAAPVIVAFVLDCFARLEGRFVDRTITAAGRARTIAPDDWRPGSSGRSSENAPERIRTSDPSVPKVSLLWFLVVVGLLRRLARSGFAG